MADPLITVGRIASEGILLVVSHHFEKHSSEPDGPANVVSCAELFVFFLGVQDQGGEECEKHPHTYTEGRGDGVLYEMYHVAMAVIINGEYAKQLYITYHKSFRHA